MSVPTIEEVREFIKENESFFKTPIQDQEKFRKFYSDINAIEDISQYSESLIKLLYKHTQRLTKESVTPVVYSWRKEDFEPALQHEAIRQFIMDNKDHPALVKWRNGRLLEESGLDESLKQLQEKATELRSRNYPDAAKAAENLVNALEAQKKEFLLGKIDKGTFVSKCKDEIDIAQKSTLKDHRGFFANIWHGLKVALNFITRGYVEITPTDSMQKTVQLRDTLKSFSQAEEENNKHIPKQ